MIIYGKQVGDMLLVVASVWVKTKLLSILFWNLLCAEIIIKVLLHYS